MSTVEKEECKYLVMKWYDIASSLSGVELKAFVKLIDKVSAERKASGKKENNYIVCNQDEPYAEKIWQMILDGEREKRHTEADK